MSPLFNAVMDSISRWSVGSSKISTLLPIDHHAGKAGQRTFSPPERTLHFLRTVISGEQHTSEETADIGCILDLGELCQPVNDQKIGIKDLRCYPSGSRTGWSSRPTCRCRNPAPSHRQES